MRLSKDLREFIELLNSRHVEYVIVGAYSLAFHARPRFTGDLDILVRPSEANARRVVALLEEFGFTELNLHARDLIEPGQVIELGRVPNRVDLLTSITGVATDDVFFARVSGELDGLPVFFLSKQQLIDNKRAVARPQDLADLSELSAEAE